MKEPITIYSQATGEIICVQRIEPGPFQMLPGEAFLPGAFDGSLHFVDVDALEVVSKPTMEIGIDGNVLTGIPIGAIIIVNLRKDPEPIEDGDHELVVDHPQTVHVVLQHPRYLAWEQEVECAPYEG